MIFGRASLATAVCLLGAVSESGCWTCSAASATASRMKKKDENFMLLRCVDWKIKAPQLQLTRRRRYEIVK